MTFIFAGLVKIFITTLDLIFGKHAQPWKVRECFKCLRCDKTDDDSDRMREHIAQKHTLDKASKCNFCGHEDKTWLGLKKHYKLNHINKH